MSGLGALRLACTHTILRPPPKGRTTSSPLSAAAGATSNVLVLSSRVSSTLSMVPLTPLAASKETRQSPLGESGMGLGGAMIAGGVGRRTLCFKTVGG